MNAIIVHGLINSCKITLFAYCGLRLHPQLVITNALNLVHKNIFHTCFVPVVIPVIQFSCAIKLLWILNQVNFLFSKVTCYFFFNEIQSDRGSIQSQVFSLSYSLWQLMTNYCSGWRFSHLWIILLSHHPLWPSTWTETGSVSG